ncbi:hypothetical protein ACFLQ2_02465 [archaeon]
MGRGVVAFLVLLSFVPTAFHALSIYQTEANGIRETRQLFLEHQAITVKEQDFEETFWRAVEYSGSQTELDAALADWKKEMRAQGIDVWYGDTGGPGYSRLLESAPNSEIRVERLPSNITAVMGGRYDAIGATITVGNSKGVYLIPMGCWYEHS